MITYVFGKKGTQSVSSNGLNIASETPLAVTSPTYKGLHEGDRKQRRVHHIYILKFSLYFHNLDKTFTFFITVLKLQAMRLKSCGFKKYVAFQTFHGERTGDLAFVKGELVTGLVERLLCL